MCLYLGEMENKKVLVVEEEGLESEINNVIEKVGLIVRYILKKGFMNVFKDVLLYILSLFC